MAVDSNESERVVSAHYTRADLGAAILAAIQERGGDPDHPTFADLAPFDHYHGGSRPATLALLRLADPPRGLRVLDVGGGIGGPARTLAHDRDCHVTVLDATPAFCAVGEMLTARTGLAERVTFVQGSAFAMPFVDGDFDLAWMQYVGMHIPDKGRLFVEIARVLRPGGRFALQEILAGAVQPAHYPMPWAATAAESFLPTEEELRDALATAGLREVAREALPGLPPVPDHVPLSPLSHLIWDEAMSRTMEKNIRRNAAEGRMGGVMIIAERG
jgi:ubiquinone/menaquinone biosynthesis C-methylase UbiE